MTTFRPLLIPLFLLSSTLALAEPAAASAATAEAPAALDPVEVNAAKRAELAFRTVQIALERGRSDRVEDADQVVCLKQTPVGSHVAVINCATNRFWLRVRAASLANGLAGFERSAGPADGMKMATASMVSGSGMDGIGVPKGSGPIKREDERVITLSLNEYNKLKKRYGELPPELRGLLGENDR
jgi:hypothetical protein